MSRRDRARERVVEVVAGALIERRDGRLLMAKSPKWNNKWVYPGGHVELGESIEKAAAREAHEETGLSVKPVHIFMWGEAINPKDYPRPVHFIYFDVHCKLVKGRVSLQKEELSEWKWLTPEEALGLDLEASHRRVIKEFISYRKRSRSVKR